MIYLFYKVRKEDICLIKFILESYENLMTISTIDLKLPKIQITIAPDFFQDCQVILNDLEKIFLMIPLDEPTNISQGNY